MGESIEEARQELDEAERVLREGRIGASPGWIEAAERWLDYCRSRLERLAQTGDGTDDRPFPGWSLPYAQWLNRRSN